MSAPRWHGGWWRRATPLASPHFNDRPPGTPVDLVVLHSNSLPPGRYGGPAVAQATIAAAHGQEMTVVLLVGQGGVAATGPLGETDVTIVVPHERGTRVLELQLLVLHCLCDAIDLQLLGEQEP